MSTAHLQGEWARLLLASFADAGVRDVVLSPGSRSTPLVLAAAGEARLRTWDLVDERGAAFFALGRARVTGRPALLICTSGTAAANYLPAVVEAGVSHLPLLVLTADRPVELADCGANQTIDQIKLYGSHARRFVDLGTPQPSPRALRALRRTAAQAVARTLDPEPGAVHLNARAVKPLEPRPPGSKAERRLTAEVDALLARPIVQPSPPRRLAAERDLAELATLCRRSERGLIVCGPAQVAQVAERPLLERLAELTGFPVYCEPASQGRFRGGDTSKAALYVDALDALLHSPAFRRAMAPELVLQIGRSPTSGAWGRYLTEHGCAHWVVAPGWYDPESTATRLIFGEVAPALQGLVAELGKRDGSPAESAWSATFRRAEEQVWRLAGEESAPSKDSPSGLSEGAVARAVVAALPRGAFLALGNSLPIRQADTWCRGDAGDVVVGSQRGASGIDGVVSGAAGAASAWNGPAALLVGDLSFLHDLAGLAAARFVQRPFVVVVVQNRGGRIFEQLPLAADPAAEGEVFDHWTTPHDLDFSHAAALFRLPFARSTTLAELESALARALERPGASVVEAVVPPHAAAVENRRLWQRVDEALG